MLRKFIKYLASFSPLPLSKNEYYDRLTWLVIKKICTTNSVCIDVGANEGKILNMFIKQSPDAIHYAFEPLEKLYFSLVRKYGSAARIFKIAISDKKGLANFTYVVKDAAYSSLKERHDLNGKLNNQVKVETDCIDNFISATEKVQLMKLDIEGGEYDALKGAVNIIERCKPYILFEFGKGGADAFGVTPSMIFNFFSGFGYKINLLNRFLKAKPPFTIVEFESLYKDGTEYFFIAFCDVDLMFQEI